MHAKKRGINIIKHVAFSEIFVLIIAIFAFAFVLNEVSFVIGQEVNKGSSTAPTKYLAQGFAATGKAPADLKWDATKERWITSNKEITTLEAKEMGYITSTSGVGFGGYLMQGLEYAGYAAGIVMLIGQLAGWESGQTEAVIS